MSNQSLEMFNWAIFWLNKTERDEKKMKEKKKRNMNLCARYLLTNVIGIYQRAHVYAFPFT